MFKRFIVFISILVISVFAWYFFAIQPVSHTETHLKEFEIQSGSSIDQIGQNLSLAGLIRSRTAFKLTVIRLGLTNKIQAGYFRLSPSMSATEVVENLLHAYKRTVRITIQEGLRRQEIALILEKSLSDLDESKYKSSEFLTLTQNLEGKLFPDTYDFDPKSTTEEIVNRLAGRHSEIMSSLNVPSEKQNDVIILASLLEREAANATEMPWVAGVIENRLNAGWPLQIDAAVQFALANVRCKKIDCDWWPKDLSKNDLKTNSPFNTYLNKGLPPTPISNPGKAALSAAAHPAKVTSWFYLHDLDGKIHFADTVEQHNQNVCTFLKKDCQ